MSLVADYGDSSPSSSDSDSTASSESATEPATPQKLDRLPTPAFIESSNTTENKSNASVFSNPFKDAENAKQAILEKHVKMVETKDNVRIINGKKICWNYRKGRCRFGHNCIYAHDSDIQKTKEELEVEKQVQRTVLFQNQAPPQPTVIELQQIQEESAAVSKGKKRPGLTQGLVPGKKVMKNYREQRKPKTSGRK